MGLYTDRSRLDYWDRPLTHNLDFETMFGS
jgi:hypothetical protein